MQELSQIIFILVLNHVKVKRRLKVKRYQAITKVTKVTGNILGS